MVEKRQSDDSMHDACTTDIGLRKLRSRVHEEMDDQMKIDLEIYLCQSLPLPDWSKNTITTERSGRMDLARGP